MSSVELVPDGSVVWNRQRLLGGFKGVLYISPDAPVQTVDWLQSSKPPQGSTHLGNGHHAAAHRFTQDGSDLVFKESQREPNANSRGWERMCGLSALKLNVALEQGLRNMGEAAILSTGARLTTPQHHGLYVSRGIARMVMSFESGQPVLPGDEMLIATRAERHAILDEAIANVGMDPTTIEGYDDHTQNLVVRQTEQGPEVVLFDAANSRVTAFAPDELI